MKLPPLQDFQQAQDRIHPYLPETPLVYSEKLSILTGYTIYLKLEIFQPTASFKPRGAMNKILQLTDSEKDKGVITASTGNHGQAVAFVGRNQQIPTVVVVPQSAPSNKVAAIRDLGAEIVVSGKTWNDSFTHCLFLAEERNMTVVHPFDDPAIIAGQGTVAMEILQQLPTVEGITAGIGGGGLIAGIARATKLLNPKVKVFGVDPEGAAAMSRSLEANRQIELDEIRTQAEGLASKTIGHLNLAIAQEHLDDVIVVSDDEIRQAVMLLLDNAKVLTELAGAASFAAALKGLPIHNSAQLVCVLSGGNIEQNNLAQILHQ